MRLAFLLVHIRTKRNCIKTVRIKRTCNHFHVILVWFYIEMLILIKYVNLNFSPYQVEFWSYSDSLLASPHLDSLCPSPGIWRGDDNIGLQIIGFCDARWHWCKPIRVITSHALQFKWWWVKTPCLQWRRYTSKYS